MPKRSQINSDMLKYFLIAIASAIILAFGYAMIRSVSDKGCDAQITRLQIDLGSIYKTLRTGARELQSYNVQCGIDKIYFFDVGNFTITSAGEFSQIPVMRDSLESASSSNIFLIKSNKVEKSFYGGELKIAYPHYLCLVPKSSSISLLMENKGGSLGISAPDGQMQCS